MSVAVVSAAPIVQSPQGIVAAVDESPTAAEWLHQAREHAAANPSESARLCSRLMHELSDRLVATSQPDHFQTVARAVGELLVQHPAVLERYRAEVGAQARATLDQGDATRAARMFPMTTAGLDAMLTEAASSLQAGRADESRAWLAAARGHPDEHAPEFAARITLLRGMAAWASGDEHTLATVVEAARASHHPDEVLAAGRLTAMGALPGTPNARWQSEAVTDASADVPVPPLMRAWTITLDAPGASPFDITGSDPSVEDPTGVGNATQPVASPSIVPLIVGERVVVHDGRVVECIDLLTHATLWRQSLVLDRSTRTNASGLQPCIVDGASVLVAVSAGDSVRTLRTTVASLDLADGRERWARTLSEGLDGAPEGLSLAGPAAVSCGVVALPCVRQVGRLELAAWLIGLRTDDGALAWAVPLGAANGLLSEFASRGTSTSMGTTEHDGAFLVGTPTGICASIDAVTGAVRWLARSSLATIRMSAMPMAYESPVPVVTGDRAWFVAADGRAVVCRTVGDGALVAAVPAGVGEPLGQAQYVLASGACVIGIGTSVSAVAADAPEHVLWSLPSASRELGTTIVGRAVVARIGEEPVVLIPRVSTIEVRRAMTGEVVATIPVEVGGNASVGAHRLLVASHTEVSAYGAPHAIIDALAERVARAVGDAAEAESVGDAEIALAEAAFEQGDGARALRMAAHCLQRLDAQEHGGSDARDRAITALLGLVQQGLEAESAAALLARAVRTPDQRVRLALAMSEREALNAQWGRAASVLADAVPALADDAMVDREGVDVRASVVLSAAVDALTDRARAAGSDAIERAADAAVLDGAEAFSRRWRGTRRAVTELISAAERSIARGDGDAARRQSLRAALLLSQRAERGVVPDAGDADRLIAALVDLGVDGAGEVATLTRVERAIRTAGVASPSLESGLHQPELAALLRPRLPVVTRETPASRRAIQFAASIANMDELAARQRDAADAPLCLDGGQLVVARGAALAPRWSLGVADHSPAFVRLWPNPVVLERPAGVSGRLTSIDADTGQVAWSIEELDDLLDPVRPIDGWRDDEESASRRGAFAASPAGDGVIVMRGDGSCVRLDALGQAMWKSHRVLPMVERMQSFAGQVAVQGLSLDAEPAIAFVSKETGQSGGGVEVTGLASTELLLWSMSGLVVQRGLSTALVELTEAGPRVAWHRQSPPGGRRRTLALNDESLFVARDGEASYRLRLEDGSAHRLPWSAGRIGAWEQIGSADGAAIIAESERLMMVNGRGEVIGSTTLAPGLVPRAAVPCAEGLLVVSHAPPVFPRTMGETELTLVDPRHGLRQVRTIRRAAVVTPPGRVLLMDEWLLLTYDDECVALPMGPG